MTAVQILHWVSALVVLAESLNKLERSAPCAPGLNAHDRLVVVLKSLAWMLLAMGSGVALAAPVMLAMGWPGDYQPALQLERPTASDTAVMLGFAVLIVRTRVKEG